MKTDINFSIYVLCQFIRNKLQYQRTATAINKISDYALSKSYEEKEKSQTWKKSSKIDLSSKYSNSLTENEKCWKKNATNNSTISPHISAYKNSNEVSTDSLNKNFPKSWSQNSFEFQRQQNDKGSEPKVLQYKASQRLLKLNKSDLYFNTDTNIVKKTVTPRPIPLPRKLCNIPAIKAPPHLIFELTVNNEEEENVETKLSESSKSKLPDTTGHEMTWLSTSQPKSSRNSNIIPIKVESKLLSDNKIAIMPSPFKQSSNITPVKVESNLDKRTEIADKKPKTKKTNLLLSKVPVNSNISSESSMPMPFKVSKVNDDKNLIPNEPLKMMQQHRKVESKMQPPSKRILNFPTKIESKLDEKLEIVGKKSKAVNLLPLKLPALSSTPSASMPMTLKMPKVNDDDNWMNVKINDKISKKLIPSSTFKSQQTTKKLNFIQNEPSKMIQRDEATIPPPSKSSLIKIELNLEQRIEIADKKFESKYASLLPSKVPVSAGNPLASMPMPNKVPKVNELGDNDWMNVKITRKTPLLLCPSLSFRQIRTPNFFENELLKQRREPSTQFHRYDPKISPTNIQNSIPQQKLSIKNYPSKRPLPPPDKSHPKFKTELCRRSITYRGCRFGKEGCNFLHPGETVPSFEFFRQNKK